MELHVLAVVTSLRDFDFQVDVWQRLRARGGQVQVLALPSAGDAVRAEVAAHALLAFPVSREATKACDDVAAISGAICDADPDVVLWGNLHAACIPSIFERLKECGFRGKCVGLQDDLVQPWRRLNERLAADYWICCGTKHWERLRPELRDRAFVAGMPVLDRMNQLKPGSGGYVLFAPNPSADQESICAALKRYELAIKVPVVVTPGNHSYAHRTALPLPAALRASGGWSRQQWLQHADIVIAFAGVDALSALYLGKSVVILPNAALPGFEEYPGISDGFSPRAINDALGRLVAQPTAVRDFLRENVGGVRFDHCEQVCCAIERLISDREFNHAGAPHLEAARQEWNAHHSATLAR